MPTSPGRLAVLIVLSLAFLGGRGDIWLCAPWALVAGDQFIVADTALAQDADDDNDGDDDGDGDDGGAGGAGGGGAGAGGGGAAAGGGGAGGAAAGADGFSLEPSGDCFEEASLLPSWLEDCEPVRQRVRTVTPVVTSPGAAAPSAGPTVGRTSPTRFRPGSPDRGGFPGTTDGGPDADADAIGEALPREIVLLNASETDIASLIARGYSVLDRAPEALLGANLVRLAVPDDLSTLEGLALARQIAPAVIADLNHIYRPGQGPCTGLGCRPRALIAWPQAPGACDAAARVGVIDTRVATDAPALRGQSIEVIDGVSGGRPASGADHGTAIAALIAGRPDAGVSGLLPAAILVAIEAFHRSPDGDDIADTYDVVRALDTMVRRSVPVVNLSFTGPANELLKEAVRIASARSVVLVASAGNKGPRSGPLYPAAYQDAVAVTAVSEALRVYRNANRGAFIDFAGPGVGIEVASVAPGQTVRIESGTSFATPFVTAAIAAAIARKGGPPADIIAQLRSRARDLGRPGRDATFGWGLIQAEGICR